jgi:hypothetical protein
MEGLEVKLSNTTDQFMRKAALLMAKHDLYDACFHEVVRHAQMSSPEFGAVLRKLRTVHRDLFHEFPGVLSDVKPHFLQRLSDIHSELVRSEKESAMLLDAAEVLEKEATAHVGKCLSRLTGTEISVVKNVVRDVMFVDNDVTH